MSKQPLHGSRFTQTNNNNQNQNNNNKSSRFGGNSSRFGGSSNNKGKRFGSSNNSSRFGASRFSGSANNNAVQWTIAPVQKTAIRISLHGLGDPFHRLLDVPLDQHMRTPAKIAERLAQDTDLAAQLTSVLNDAWASYDWQGACLLHPWEPQTRRAYTNIALPMPPLPPNDNTEEYEYEDSEDDDSNPQQTSQHSKRTDMHILRAIDVAFVLNIIARARANILVSNTIIALEQGFLERTVICDDPRLVRIAQATGYIDEEW